jgi:hypothetical protein
MGADSGLNLTTPDETKAIATKVAAVSGEESTGFNLIAQNLGSGLSGQLVPAFGGIGGGGLPIGMLAFSLAQGIGQGTASGLNLTQQQFAPSKGSDVMTIVKNLGLGLTGPIASSIDVNKLVGQAGGSSDIMAQLPQIAAAAGVGLGRGASRGLGWTKSGGMNGSVAKRQAAIDPAKMDVPGIVGNLTMGLSQSFLESTDLDKLVPSGGSGLNFDSSALISLASGAGKGIGEGISLGLGGTAGNNTSLASRATDGGTLSAEQIAEQFTKNLMASLIQNGGIEAIGDTVTSQAGGLMSSIDVAKVAEGAARGLVEGSVSALSEAGGFQKVLKGDFPKELATNLPTLPHTQFNDSLNGSIVAFMRGLSGEGVLLISQLFNGGTNSSAAPPAKRSVDAGVGELKILFR